MDGKGKVSRLGIAAAALFWALVAAATNSPAASADGGVLDDRIAVTFPGGTPAEQRTEILKSIRKADAAVRDRFALEKRDYSIAIVAHQAGGLS